MSSLLGRLKREESQDWIRGRCGQRRPRRPLFFVMLDGCDDVGKQNSISVAAWRPGGGTMKNRNHDAGEGRQRVPLRPSNPSFELLQKALEVIRRKVEKGDGRAAKWVLGHKEEPANSADRPLCLDPYHAILNHFDMRLIHLLVTAVLTAEEFNCEVLPNLAELKKNRVHQKALEVIRRKVGKGDLGAAIWVLGYRKELANSTDRPLCMDPDHACYAQVNLSLILMLATAVTTAEAFYRELPPDLAEVKVRWDRLRGEEGKSDGSSGKGPTKL